MKTTIFMILLAACVPDGPPDWRLQQDRVLAVRAEPPGVAPGAVSTLAVMLAQDNGPVIVVPPQTMSAASSPLFTAVHYNIDHWQIDGPDEAQLADARAQLGLADGAPVPLDVELRAPGPLYATKRVWLGVLAANPSLPPVSIDGATPSGTIDLARERATSLHIEAASAHWFTSCGELTDDREASTTLVTSGACVGQLVVVVRDGMGGVVWSVWPLRVE